MLFFLVISFVFSSFKIVSMFNVSKICGPTAFNGRGFVEGEIFNRKGQVYIVFTTYIPMAYSPVLVSLYLLLLLFPPKQNYVVSK